MPNSVPQKLNKPTQVYKQSKKQEMQDYPEYYYKEIVKFIQNSNNWIL